MVDSLAWALSLAHTEHLLNQALSYSIEWPDYAAKLNHIVLRCELLPVNKSVYVIFTQNQVSLKTHYPGAVDLTISAPPSALLEMLQKKRAGSQIHIAGNAHLAQTLQQAIGALNIDWEGLLASHIGDIPARQTSLMLGKLKDFANRFIDRTLSDTADYLVDEKQLLPSHIEVDAFYQEVTQIRYAVDRLEARLRLLEVNDAE